LLNQGSRFYDKRIGQSTTLNGRQIVKHMSAHLNQNITGEYDHSGEAIVYGDTDSCYFSAWPIVSKNSEMLNEWSKEVAIQLYDELGDAVNKSFPEFMERAFHCPRKNGEIIKAGRELVADRGIFITKKRYAVNIIDKEGKRLDVDGRRGIVKAMGLELKRADTPKYVQEFLSEILEDVLFGVGKDQVIEKIRNFKQQLSERNPWELGSPKGVKKLTHYETLNDRSKTGKVNMPGHVRASLNWNYLRRMNGDNYSIPIMDGLKVVVCKVKPNALGMTSIAFPTDELRLPDWFKELSFDTEDMIRSLVDEKVENMLGVLKWDLREYTNIINNFNDLFSFG
jgi:DNA polymerase elongation subunit (family B)